MRGGHFIPDDVVLRRYHAGIRNLFNLYLPVLDSCHIIDNSCQEPLLLAKYDHSGWQIMDAEKLEFIQELCMKQDNLTELLMEGFRKAVAKAIAEHEREGRGDMVRAAQAGPDGCWKPRQEHAEAQNSLPHA